MSQSEDNQDSYTWNQYDIFFDCILENLIVAERVPATHGGTETNHTKYYSFKDNPLYLSYNGIEEKINVQWDQDYSNFEYFREFLVLDKATSYPTISFFNFDGELDGKSERWISLRTGGLGIIDLTDTDPVYYSMMSYELNQSQKHNNKDISIKAVQISRGELTRGNTYAGENESRDHSAICFKVFYQEL